MAQTEELNYHFKWENHPNDAFPKFHSLFQQRRFLDVTLVAAEGRTLKAHIVSFFHVLASILR